MPAGTPGEAQPPAGAPAPRRLWPLALRFLLVLAALQFAWSAARGTMVERLVIDQATVGCAVKLIHLVNPDLPVQGEGSRIVAPGGGVNILNGCEGTEVWFLLLAALATGTLSARIALLGGLAGTVLVFVLNQIRVVVLFFSYRDDHVLFDRIHGLYAPLALVLLILLFFLGLQHWDRGDPAVASDRESS